MEVESIAREALATSNRSYILLSGIIADDSIAAGITDAEDGLQSLQSQMEELVEEVDEVLKEAKRASAEQSRGANFTLPRNLTELEPEGWNSFIAETENLESALQAAEQQIEKLLLELEPRVKAFMMGMETKETFDELLRRVKFSEASARESIQKVRRIKEDGLSLLKTLEDNKRLFPAGKVRSQGTWRKMSAVKERVMVEAKRKTSLARRALRVAESSSTISNTTATRAWHLSRGVAKDAQKTRSRAQDQAAQSGLLRTQLGTMQDQLVAQEHQAAAFKVKFQEDSKTSAKVLHETEAMGKKVTKAKQSLDRDLKQLTKLLKTVESLQVDQVTEEMLNKTEVEMGALRWVIDQKLDQKLRELEAASDLQILKMKAIEKDMEDIEAEKLSLEDIVQNLPQGCYNRVGL